VVEIDVGDDRDGAVEDVGGVPAAEHAYLHDGGIDSSIGEYGECRCGNGLEPAWCHTDTPSHPRHPAKSFGEFFSGDGVLVEGDALGHIG